MLKPALRPHLTCPNSVLSPTYLDNALCVHFSGAAQKQLELHKYLGWVRHPSLTSELRRAPQAQALHFCTTGCQCCANRAPMKAPISESCTDCLFHAGYLPLNMPSPPPPPGSHLHPFFALARPADARPPDSPQCLLTTSASTASAQSRLSLEPKGQKASVSRGTRENGLAFLVPWLDR